MRSILCAFALACAATPALAAMAITSPDLAPGAQMPAKHIYPRCGGQNVSPALAWSGAPAGTKSFAVTVYDPDAPTGSGWWHWVVFNIPASAKELPRGAGDAQAKGLPAGSIQSRTDFGKPGYGGPCPPAGDKPHRYQFTVYALKTDKLPLDENAPAAMVGFYLHQNLIQKAMLNASYGR